MTPRLGILALACVGVAACDLSDEPSYDKRVVEGGDPARGQAILASGIHGCPACHAIPGVDTIKGVVGPPLAGLAWRGSIAGQLPNRPGMLIAFLQNPPALVPETGMPDVGLTNEEARDVAAYLYTLEAPDAW